MVARYGRGAVVAALREGLAEARLAAGAMPDTAAILAGAAAHLAGQPGAGLVRVINASGIILHTNLGRAPLAGAALDAMRAAAGYCDLEYDLPGGRRGARGARLEALVAQLAGAEAALVVNNGAAAILLALAGLAGAGLAGAGLAGGGEVIVARGELVEIGGGFRIPEVIAAGGARLVEVGATNIVRLSDYRAAITADTRVLLKVHQSNFRMVGFTCDVGIGALAGLAREAGLRVVADLGSGLIAPTPGVDEPTLRDALAAGADVVTCSGDKLLGGPQAGLIAGRAEALAPLRRHPLLRALRLGKVSLAGLEATLRLHRDAPGAVPVLAMLAQGDDVLAARAEALRIMVGSGAVVASEGYAGGGALPGRVIASRALALEPAGGADAAATSLRAADPPVVARIAGGRLLIDMLALGDGELRQVAEALRGIIS